MTEQEKQPTHGAKVRLDRAQEQAQDQPSRFLTIYQDPETNKAFYSKNTREAAQEFIQLTLEGFEPTIKTDGNALTIQDYTQLTDGLKESSKKLLDFVTAQLAATNGKNHSGKNYKVLIDIQELAELYGKDISTPSKLKDFRKELNNDLATLYNVSITLKDYRNKGRQVDFRICQAKGIDKEAGRSGVYFFHFGQLFADYLIEHNLITPLPLSLFTVSSKALSFPLGRYLVIRYNMDSNVAAKNNDIISVKALLEHFSSYFSIGNNRHWEERIKDRLEAALDELEEAGVLHWAYCGAKKKTMEDEPTTRKDFEAAYIHFDILDTPDGSERRKRKAIEKKRKAQRKAKAQTKAAKAAKAAADSGQMHLTDE